jgi:hypothetical protein
MRRVSKLERNKRHYYRWYATKFVFITYTDCMYKEYAYVLYAAYKIRKLLFFVIPANHKWSIIVH